MRRLGVDIGSRAIKVAVLEDGQVAKLRLGARHFVSRHFDCPALTEIKAVAAGAHFLDPEVRAIVDIGGQDTKAVAVGNRGRMLKFSLNDRCAAGTGRFLEVMATAMGLRLEEFVDAALTATGAETLSSLCAVFAESEVVSMIARGAARDQLALGIHRSVVGRTLAMLNGLPLDGPVMFTGGGARNRCLVRELSAVCPNPLRVPEQAQHAAAIGCALIAGCCYLNAGASVLSAGESGEEHPRESASRGP